MSTKITMCDRCRSINIKELNPKNRDIVNGFTCRIECICNDCGFKFMISSWTVYGKRRGILY